MSPGPSGLCSASFFRFALDVPQAIRLYPRRTVRRLAPSQSKDKKSKAIVHVLSDQPLPAQAPPVPPLPPEYPAPSPTARRAISPCVVHIRSAHTLGIDRHIAHRPPFIRQRVRWKSSPPLPRPRRHGALSPEGTAGRGCGRVGVHGLPLFVARPKTKSAAEPWELTTNLRESEMETISRFTQSRVPRADLLDGPRAPSSWWALRLQAHVPSLQLRMVSLVPQTRLGAQPEGMDTARSEVRDARCGTAARFARGAGLLLVSRGVRGLKLVARTTCSPLRWMQVLDISRGRRRRTPPAGGEGLPRQAVFYNCSRYWPCRAASSLLRPSLLLRFPHLCLVFAVIMMGLSDLRNCYTAFETGSSEESNTASRSVKPGPHRFGDRFCMDVGCDSSKSNAAWASPAEICKYRGAA
ncbi:hypothetical protein BKA93DRAFT_824957 [Sparassis latifolia]